MPIRLFAAVVLFCAFIALAAAQGTPGGKTPILTGFAALPEKLLQEGAVRLFDGISTYGWKGDVKIQNGALHFSGTIEETPYWFLGNEKGISGTFTSTHSSVAPDKFRLEAGELFMKMDQDATKPLFNGKTLDGWTIRGNAEAEVKEGAIRLTKGSGSLESDGKYGDFILQLEYFTPVRPEGQGINSGVFFRCIPGETMNGYECQILNKPGDRDYQSFIGTDTGGLFRRQVGRNVGPKDGEWNYLTIVARGARMATWVNGIQVTDWTDERAPHNNPRNGLRTEAGTIQFQGHDPGTEILFRNIRIREL